MTATVASIVKDHELMSSGLVESASVKSITDFMSSELNESEVTSGKEKDDFLNIFICHLIFYVVFCVSLVLHILIDLGLGSFIKNNFYQLFGLINKPVFEEKPAFA
tara:strand:- start:3779 stop:4096 length:318 start_codon:yes stop_codon:yes gene_type:complete